MVPPESFTTDTAPILTVPEPVVFVIWTAPRLTVVGEAVPTSEGEGSDTVSALPVRVMSVEVEFAAVAPDGLATTTLNEAFCAPAPAPVPDGWKVTVTVQLVVPVAGNAVGQLLVTV